MYSVQSISVTFISKILFVIVALWNPSFFNAIIVLTLGYFIATVFFVLIKKDTFNLPNYWDGKSVKSLALFGLPLMPVTLLSWLNISLPQFMLKNYVDFSAIGIYTSALAIAGTISIVQAGFTIYWNPFVYKNYKINQNLIKQIHSLLTFFICIVAFVIIFSQDYLYLLLGEKYRISQIFFPFLIIAPMCFTISESTGIGIGISKKTYLNIISFLVSVVVNIIFSLILIPYFEMAGAAFSSAISALILVSLKTFLGEKYYQVISSKTKTFGSIMCVFVAAIFNYIFFEELFIKNMLFIILFLGLVFLNRKDIKEILLKLKKRKEV